MSFVTIWVIFQNLVTFTAMAADFGVKKGIILSKRQTNDDAHTGDTFWDSGNRLLLKHIMCFLF